MTKLIEDYGLIGNMVSAALVGRDGSIDWLCLPRFISAACFAALLGGPEHGRWLISPADTSGQTSRCYLRDTAVIETRFETQEGAVTVTDFMPFTQDEERVDVVRIVRGVRGHVRMSMELTLRFQLRPSGTVGPAARLWPKRDFWSGRCRAAHFCSPRGPRHEHLRGVHGARRGKRTFRIVLSSLAQDAAICAG